MNEYDAVKIKVLLDYYKNIDDNWVIDGKIKGLIDICKSTTTVDNIRKCNYWAEVERPEYEYTDYDTLAFEYKGISIEIDLHKEDE